MTKSKKRIILIILFVILTITGIVIIGFNKLSKNILIGSWITDDGVRNYTFDEHTLTISSEKNSYSEIYGYSYKDMKLYINKNDKTEVFDIIKIGNKIKIVPADNSYDSEEVLVRK